MKLLFGLLVLINIAFFLWNSSDNGDNEGQRRQSVHEDEVRLASEADLTEERTASMEEVVARGMPEIKPVTSTAAESRKPKTNTNSMPTNERPVSFDSHASPKPGDLADTAKVTEKSAPTNKPELAATISEKAGNPRPESSPAITAKADRAKPVVAQPAIKKCRTFGPYAKKKDAEKKLAKLKLEGVEAALSTSRNSAGIKSRYRVSQGPFNTVEMARARRQSLTRKGISEHFARKDDSGKYMVSLGVFSTREKADKFVASLLKKGETARVSSEKISGEPVTEYRVKTKNCK